MFWPFPLAELADTLKYFFPWLAEGMYMIIFLLLVFGILAILNIRSVKNGIRFIEYATLAKLIPLILLVIAGAAFIDPGNLQWISAPTVDNIGAASLLLFFAFMGLESPLSNGGEIINPKRLFHWEFFLVSHLYYCFIYPYNW